MLNSLPIPTTIDPLHIAKKNLSTMSYRDSFIASFRARPLVSSLADSSEGAYRMDERPPSSLLVHGAYPRQPLRDSENN
jgi:hypothetical protein